MGSRCEWICGESIAFGVVLWGGWSVVGMVVCETDLVPKEE